MKQLIVIIVASMILKPLWPWVQYTINYQFIVKYLCENKSKPKLNCNGKCFLVKQLAKESKEERKNPLGVRILKLDLPMINWFQELKSTIQILLFIFHRFRKPVELNSLLFIKNLLRPPEFKCTFSKDQ